MAILSGFNILAKTKVDNTFPRAQFMFTDYELGREEIGIKMGAILPTL